MNHPFHAGRNTVVCTLVLLAGMVTNASAEYPKFEPVSRICDKKDIPGLRKLRDVFESPQDGQYVAAVKKDPHQYVYFSPLMRMVEIVGPRLYTNPNEMERLVQYRAKEEMRQFVLGEQGVIYYYANGTPTDAYYCKIVEESAPPFAAGDMVLTKTIPETNAQVMKVYHRTRYSISPEPKPVSPRIKKNFKLKDGKVVDAAAPPKKTFMVTSKEGIVRSVRQKLYEDMRRKKAKKENTRKGYHAGFNVRP